MVKLGLKMKLNLMYVKNKKATQRVAL